MPTAQRHAASLLDNIYRSLDVVCAALTTATGITCHLHGRRQFIPPADGSAWVRVRYDGLTERRQWYRQTGDLRLGSEIAGIVALTIFQHARVWSDRYTLSVARDAVLAMFPESEVFPIFDFSAPLTPQVGVLFVESCDEQVLDTGERSGVVAYLIQVGVRFLDQFTVTA